LLHVLFLFDLFDLFDLFRLFHLFHIFFKQHTTTYSVTTVSFVIVYNKFLNLRTPYAVVVVVV